MQDQNAILSSSPAAQPSSGQHLQGDRPTVFGSVSANATDSKKVVGFAGKSAEGGAAAPVRGPMDFQKLFQGGSQPAQNSSPSAAPAVPAPAQPVAAAAASPAPTPSTSVGQAPSTPSNGSFQPQQTGKHGPPQSLRPPGPGHPPGARPFEPQRSPSQPHHPMSAQGQRGPSANGPPSSPFQPHPGHPQAGPQQPRSPHMANATMQPMQQIGGPPPQWQQHQQPMVSERIT